MTTGEFPVRPIVKPIRFTLTEKNFSDLYVSGETKFKVGLQDYIIMLDDELTIESENDEYIIAKEIEQKEPEEEEED